MGINIIMVIEPSISQLVKNVLQLGCSGIELKYFLLKVYAPSYSTSKIVIFCTIICTKTAKL